MNILNNIYIGSAYALYCPSHGSASTFGDHVLFGDGSSADLSTGFLDNKSPDKEMIIVPLVNGINHFKFGKENENPQKVSGLVTTIKVNYPGAVQIIPSDKEASVQENSSCFATIDGNTLTITPAEVTKFTYVHQTSGTLNFTGLGNMQGGNNEIPTLKIYAPTNVDVTGSCGSLKFVELNDINISTGVLSGNKARSVTSTKIKVLDCPKITNSLTVTTSSSFEIVSQLETKQVYIDNTGSLTFSNPINTNILTIKGTSSVDIKTLYCKTAEINRTSRVEIKNGIIKELTLKTTSSITIHLQSCEVINIQSTSSKDVTIDHGETSVHITESTGKVDLTLDIAKEVNVDTTSKVNVVAQKYLTKPNISTPGKVYIS